jgi:alpha-ketoglutarate-dependent taurine dioxygenase
MSPLKIRNLSDGFGAEVDGFQYDGEVDSATHLQLREAFDDRGVLVFRGLDIDRTAQAYLSELLIRDNAPTLAEAAALAGKQDGFWISNTEPGAAAPFGRLLYHKDMMWSPDPFLVNSLYGVDVAPDVVPTLFASSARAWDTLSDALRARVEGRSAIHVTGPEGFGDRRRAGLDGDVLNNIRETTPSHTTLVGHSHPRTGRTLLYVSQGMTKGIVGLSEDESEDLLEELFAHLYRQDNVIEHHWHNGDLVIWDNLALQHARAAVAAGGPPRTLRKIGSPIPAPSKADELTYQSVG